MNKDQEKDRIHSIKIFPSNNSKYVFLFLFCQTRKIKDLNIFFVECLINSTMMMVIYDIFKKMFLTTKVKFSASRSINGTPWRGRKLVVFLFRIVKTRRRWSSLIDQIMVPKDLNLFIKKMFFILDHCENLSINRLEKTNWKEWVEIRVEFYRVSLVVCQNRVPKYKRIQHHKKQFNSCETLKMYWIRRLNI